MDDNAASTTVVDSSGNGNNGTAQANTNTKSTTDAIHNRALTFNGTTDYVDLGTGINSLITNQITVTAWVKVTASDDISIVVAGQYSDITEKDFALFPYQSAGGQVYFDVGNGTVSGRATSNAGYALGNWFLIVGTYDGSNVRIYYNGVIGATVGTLTGNISFSGDSIKIGKQSGGSFFNGSIDDVRIYNRALTASDVAALYQAGSHRTGDVGFSKMLFPPIDQSVVGWWKLNDAAGQTIVKDWTANANTGTSANNIISATGYTGVANTAMTFNGTSDYVSVADSASLDGMANITIAFWGKASTFSDNAYPVGKRASYEFLANGGKLKAGVNSGDWVYATTATSITTGVWFHATVTYDGSNVKIYYNGSLEDTQPQSGLVANSTNPLGLGFLLNPAVEGYQFNGSISDVRIYNRALSAGEVKQLYMRDRP